MKDLKILIVGGGIGGLSCAIALRLRGHDVHLVELDGTFRASPTGITLQAHAYRAFARLGVAGEVASQGYTGLGSRVRRADNTLIREMLGRPLEQGLPVAGGIMRPVLQQILADRSAELGARVTMGVTFSSMVQDADGVDVAFSDGSSDRYDVVVGVDGVQSHVRGAIFPEAPEPEFTGQGSFRLVAPRPAEIDMMTMYLGNNQKAGLTPASDELLFLWTLTPEPTDAYMDKSEALSRLRQALQGYGGVIADIRDSLTPETDLIYRPLKAMMLPLPWHVGRIVVIGDAAHATTPHLSSGASAAVEDAWILAEHLSDAADVETAMREFEERRFERCRFIVETSRRIGDLEVAGAPSEEQERLYADGLQMLASIA